MSEAASGALLEEYQAAQDTYLHYDSFRWQAGSFLTAGVFVFWGLLITQAQLPSRVVATGATLVTLLMSAWMLFAHHYRQLYLCKLARIREIEEMLGLNNIEGSLVVASTKLGTGHTGRRAIISTCLFTR